MEEANLYIAQLEARNETLEQGILTLNNQMALLRNYIDNNIDENLTEDYVLSGRLSGRMFKGLYKRGRHYSHASILMCRTYEEAWEIYIDCKISPLHQNLARCDTILRNHNGEGYVVMFEPLFPLRYKIYSLLGHGGIWRTEGTGEDARIMGFSDGFKSIFQQLGDVLFTLNMNGQFSGNIDERDIDDRPYSERPDGLWMSSDNQVKLCNLKCKARHFAASQAIDMDSFIYNGIKGDVVQFRNVMESIISMHRSIIPHRQPEFPEARIMYAEHEIVEWGTFTSMYQRIESFAYIPGTNASARFVQNFSRFVYRAPLLWSFEKQSIFMEHIHQLLPNNNLIFSDSNRELLAYMDKWVEYIRNPPLQVAGVNFNVLARVSNHETNGRPRKMYEKRVGIIPLVHNVGTHYNEMAQNWDEPDPIPLRTEQKYRVDALKEICNIWPFIVGFLYRNIHFDLAGAVTGPWGSPDSTNVLLSVYLFNFMEKYKC